MTADLRLLSRREMFRRSGLGFGALALNALLGRDSTAAPTASPMSPRAPHFSPHGRRAVARGFV